MDRFYRQPQYRLTRLPFFVRLFCDFSFLILTEYGHGDQKSFHQYITLGINSLYAVKGALFFIQTLQLMEEIYSYELEACFLLSETHQSTRLFQLVFFPHHLLGFLSRYRRNLFLYLFCSLLGLVAGSLQRMNKQKIMHKLYAKYNSKGEVILTCSNLLHNNSHLHFE